MNSEVTEEKPRADQRYTTKEAPTVVKLHFGANVTASTLDGLRCLGRGPRYFKGPGRRVTYRFADLEAFFAGQAVETIASVDPVETVQAMRRPSRRLKVREAVDLAALLSGWASAIGSTISAEGGSLLLADADRRRLADDLRRTAAVLLDTIGGRCEP